MRKSCDRCKHYNSCEIVALLLKWEEEEELEIEITGASWVLDVMFCKRFEVKNE